jgi:hypothetical protein
MEINKAFYEDFVFKNKQGGVNRFTQDSPIFPEVWSQYFLLKNINKRVDLIFTVHRSYSASILLTTLREKLRDYHSKYRVHRDFPVWSLASSGETIAGKLTFDELIHVALPLTSWWQNYLWKEKDKKDTSQMAWFVDMVKAVNWFHKMKAKNSTDLSILNDMLLKKAYRRNQYKPKFERIKPYEEPTPLWAVSWNRRASISLYRSNKTIKSEPSRRLFNIDGSGITWAIIDSGIDATHSGFRLFDKKNNKIFSSPFIKEDRRTNKTRIIATYDFTKLRKIMGNLEGAILSGSNNETRSYFKNIIKNEILT